VFVKYGKSARHCLKLARDQTAITAWEKNIPPLLMSIPDPGSFQAQLAGGGVSINSDQVLKASSQIITVVPEEDRRPQVDLVSKYISSRLYDIVLQSDAKKFWDYFNQFSSVEKSRTSAGWLWESHVLRRELSKGRKRTVPLQRLPVTESGPRSVAIYLPFSEVIIYGNQENLAQHLALVIPSLAPGTCALFIPGAQNQATFDALSISADGAVKVYQPTVGKTHSVKSSGLDFLWDALVRAKDLVEERSRPKFEQLMPNKTRTWQVIFIIPEGVRHHWQRSQSIDFRGIKPKRQWKKYLEQFVMVLKETGREGMGKKSRATAALVGDEEDVIETRPRKAKRQAVASSEGHPQ
jgi:hypothetical protein